MADPSELLPYTYFNETVFQFIEDLRRVFPDDRFLPVVLAGIKVYAGGHPQALEGGFAKAFGAYVDRIERHDESFFLSHTVAEYKEDYKRARKGAEGEIARLKQELKDEMRQGSMFTRVVEYLKANWCAMDAGNKDVIWRYMDQLVRLHRVCQTRRDAHQT